MFCRLLQRLSGTSYCQGSSNEGKRFVPVSPRPFNESSRTKDIIKSQVNNYTLIPNPVTYKFAQLPKKIDEVVFCPLTPQQIKVYKRILAMDPVQNIVRKDEFCDCGSRKKLVCYKRG